MFKRVVSNPEELGGQHKRLASQHEPPPASTTSPSTSPNDAAVACPTPPPTTTTTSTLIQAKDDSLMRRAEALLLSSHSRSDSKNSVSSGSAASNDASSVRTGHSSNPNGSGNWGWFEDVHAGGGPVEHDVVSSSSTRTSTTTTTSPNTAAARKSGTQHRKETRSSRKKRHSSMLPVLQPFVGGAAELNDIVSKQQQQPPDDAAAAMAVTAPTYVLEESLSSQALWKDTAGTRPPQPVEERAFYEKMWAQNFARSRVDYQIPHEVLAASSPLFLSPFCDTQYGTATANTNDGLLPANYQNFESQATDEEIAHAIHRMHDVPSYATTSMATTTTTTTATTTSANPNASTLSTLGQKTVKGSASDGDLTVLIRGDNVFGTTVSKSFPRQNEVGGISTIMEGVDTVNISIASYRVVESKRRGKYAQFLVIYREGSIRDTIGVWKRYSDFDSLSNKVTQAHEGCSSVLANMSPMHITEESDVEHLPNAITSWRLLKKRQRWYRCLDAGYLSLKVFLLERFLHDILFESSSPTLLREFVTAGHSSSSNSSVASDGS